MCRLLQRSKDCSKESGAVWAYAQAAFEKNFIFLCDICRFDSHSICNESLRSRNPAFYSSDKCADQRLGTKRYIFMH